MEERNLDVDELFRQIKNHRVNRWDVFFIPRTVATFTNISAEGLEHGCLYRWTLRQIIKPRSHDKRLQSFFAMLPQLSATTTLDEADHRYGCSFYNVENHRVFQLCLDGVGRATLQGKRVRVSKSTVKWFQQFAAEHFDE